MQQAINLPVPYRSTRSLFTPFMLSSEHHACKHACACPGNKPSPNWQLRGQKVLNRNTQLRGQLRAAPSQAVNWQAEVQHRLSKATVVKGKMYCSGGQQGRGKNGYRIQQDHKDYKHYWSCSCFRDNSGKDPISVTILHFGKTMGKKSHTDPST